MSDFTLPAMLHALTPLDRRPKPMPKRPLVDEQSYWLAEHFLQDEPHTEDDEWSLADAIQQAVEEWFMERDEETEA